MRRDGRNRLVLEEHTATTKQIQLPENIDADKNWQPILVGTHARRNTPQQCRNMKIVAVI